MNDPLLSLILMPAMLVNTLCDHARRGFDWMVDEHSWWWINPDPTPETDEIERLLYEEGHDPSISADPEEANRLLGLTEGCQSR